MSQIHVVQELAPGGIECLAINLAEKSEERTDLVSLSGRIGDLMSNWAALEPLAARITGFAKAAGFQPRLIYQLARHFRRVKPTAIITHHIGPLLYAGLAARIAGVPVIAHIEHDAWHYENKKRRLMGRLLLRIVRPRLAAVSRIVAEGVADGVGFVPRIIANGVDVERFKPRDRCETRQLLGLPMEAKIIGCAGRLEHVKGFDLMLEALAALPSNVVLVLFGTGSQDSALREQAVRLSIGNRVIFAGLSSHMQTVYPAFDVFCLPSRFEGLPLAALEAQACNIPVIAFDVGGVREAVCLESGELVQPNNTLFLAAALNHALEFPPEKSPRAFIITHYSLEKTIREYAELTRI